MQRFVHTFIYTCIYVLALFTEIGFKHHTPKAKSTPSAQFLSSKYYSPLKRLRSKMADSRARVGKVQDKLVNILYQKERK